MTTLDKSVPDIPVLMVMPRKHVQKEIPLEPGYAYVPAKGMREPWAELMVKTGLIQDLETARSVFDSFGEDVESRFLFVVDEAGNLASTAGLYPGRYFPDRLRVHYVATDPDHQGHGLAKSILTRLCLLYDAIPSPYPLYLATQSGSWPAIILYSRLGFTPYLGESAVSSAADNEEAWEKVTEILRQKTGQK